MSTDNDIAALRQLEHEFVRIAEAERPRMRMPRRRFAIAAAIGLIALPAGGFAASRTVFDDADTDHDGIIAPEEAKSSLTPQQIMELRLDRAPAGARRALRGEVSSGIHTDR